MLDQLPEVREGHIRAEFTGYRDDPVAKVLEKFWRRRRIALHRRRCRFSTESRLVTVQVDLEPLDGTGLEEAIVLIANERHLLRMEAHDMLYQTGSKSFEYIRQTKIFYFNL